MGENPDGTNITMNDIKTETKWILVAGSSNALLPEKIVLTSKRLGRELADAGFGLVTGGWPGVDHHVARAFAEGLKEAGGSLAGRLTQFLERGRTPDFPSGRFITRASDAEAWEASIVKADAVVLIGGIGGTYETGQLALRQGKPVLPLADTRDGGHSDAYKFYFEMLQNWDARPIKGLTSDQYPCLADPAPGVVTDLVRLLETMFGHQSNRILSAEVQRQSNRAAALELWREKLEYLLKEEALVVDSSSKFKLKKEIEEAQEKIRLLGGAL